MRRRTMGEVVKFTLSTSNVARYPASAEPRRTVFNSQQALTDQCSYQELGGDWFDQRRATQAEQQRLTRQPEASGLRVPVEPTAACQAPLRTCRYTQEFLSHRRRR